MQGSSMGGTNRYDKKIKALSVFLMLAAMTLAGGSFSSAKGAEPGPVPVIVIDPGHGGNDTGVTGPGGTKEKNLTLGLAKILAATFSPAFSTVLTRTGDYQLPLTQRASAANTHHGDLFISLHTGGSRRHEANRWSVFYFAPPDHGSRLQSTAKTKQPIKKEMPGPGPAWEQVSLRHQQQSRAFAQHLKTRLELLGEIPGITVMPAALRVLEGLDMPAIVMETGYLTHRETETLLNDPVFLKKMATQIKKSVERFLAK